MAVSSILAFSLAFSGAAAPQGEGAKITFVSAGISAEKALQEISAKTGTSLLVAPTTAHEVLAISVTDVPLKALMEKVAWAVGGSWKKEGEAYRLVRTSEDVAAEKARERDSLLQSFEKALAARREELAKEGELTAAKADAVAEEAARKIRTFNPDDRGNQNFWQFSSKLTAGSPAGRAVTKLTNLLTPRELADLPKGIRVVYSTNPTRTQRTLGGNATGIIKQLMRDQAIWSDAMAKHHVKNPMVGNTTYVIFPDLQEQENQSTSGKVGKVLFALTRANYIGGGVQMELLVGDEKGRVITRGSGNVAMSMYPMEKQPDPPKDDPKVALGADAASVMPSSGPMSASKVPAELRARLMQPEVHEPLGILSGQTILNAGKVRKANVVASMSDLAFMFGGFGSKEIPYTIWLRNQRAMNEVDDRQGWLAIRPIGAPTARAIFVDRKVLGTYLRRVASGARMNVEEKAYWALQLPLDEESQLHRMLATFVAQGETQGYGYEYNNARLLRFYGSLTKAQRATAKQGGVPLGSLTEAQLDLIRYMVYAQHSNLQPDYQKAHELKIDVNNFYNGLLREPTESLPNGIPPDGVFELKETTAEVAFTADRQMQGYMMPSQGMDPSQIAWQQFAQTRLDLFPYMKEPYQQIDLNQLRLGKRTTYNLSIKFTQILQMANQLEDREYTVAKAGGYNSLPAAFREAIEKQVAEYKKMYANSQVGTPSNGGQVVPPPR